MKKNVVIKQPAGLGDIFFTQKIAETFLFNDYNVYWPVQSSISWIKDYLVNSKNVNYINQNNFTPPTDYITVCLDGAESMTGGLIMTSKYQILDIDWVDWSTYFNFKRNIDKENHLFYNVLGLRDGEDYVFVNKHYGTPPNFKLFDINIDENEKNINLELFESYTLFDWIKVVENASKIIMIDSSLNYIIEKLNLKTDNLVCYCRHGEYTYKQIAHLFNKKWQYK